MSWEFFEWTGPIQNCQDSPPFKTKDLWLSLNEFFPAYVEHIVRWFVHGQIHHHGCHSLPRNSPCFLNEKKRSSGPALISYLWAPHWAKLSTPTTNLRTRFGKRLRTMICWHDGHLLLNGCEVCRMFKTLKRAGELELLSDWNTGHLRWVESKMVFSCNMRFLVLPLQERFRQTWDITKPKPVRVLHAAPIALLRDEKTSTAHDESLFIYPPPRIAITLYQAHLQTAVLTHLHKAAGLDVAANGWYHKTRSLYSNQGANDDHVSGRQTLDDKQGSQDLETSTAKIGWGDWRVYYLF